MQRNAVKGATTSSSSSIVSVEWWFIFGRCQFTSWLRRHLGVRSLEGPNKPGSFVNNECAAEASRGWNFYCSLRYEWFGSGRWLRYFFTLHPRRLAGRGWRSEKEPDRVFSALIRPERRLFSFRSVLFSEGRGFFSSNWNLNGSFRERFSFV